MLDLDNPTPHPGRRGPGASGGDWPVGAGAPLRPATGLDDMWWPQGHSATAHDPGSAGLRGATRARWHSGSPRPFLAAGTAPAVKFFD